MNVLLQWQLPDQASLTVNAPAATLATATFCSLLTIIFKQEHNAIVVADQMQFSNLEKLYVLLNHLIEQKKDQICFQESIAIVRKGSDFSLSINSSQLSFDCIIDLGMLVSWSRQLELLRIVMEENEQEQKQSNQGCC